MMRLHNLKPAIGAKHSKKRKGIGESSGHGKTSGRGGKGQSARSGSSIRIGFEGGQMPLIRRMPKRGFNNTQFKRHYFGVNLEDLNIFEEGALIDEKILQSSRLVSGNFDGIKILARGILQKRLIIRASAFSSNAILAIKRIGGVAEVVN